MVAGVIISNVARLDRNGYGFNRIAIQPWLGDRGQSRPRHERFFLQTALRRAGRLAELRRVRSTMPSRPRIDLPHVTLHIVQRGNDRQPCLRALRMGRRRSAGRQRKRKRLHQTKVYSGPVFALFSSPSVSGSNGPTFQASTSHHFSAQPTLSLSAGLCLGSSRSEAFRGSDRNG